MEKSIAQSTMINLTNGALASETIEQRVRDKASRLEELVGTLKSAGLSVVSNPSLGEGTDWPNWDNMFSKK